MSTMGFGSIGNWNAMAKPVQWSEADPMPDDRERQRKQRQLDYEKRKAMVAVLSTGARYPRKTKDEGI